MRVSPALQVTVRRMEVWQRAVALCIACAVTALALWWGLRDASSTIDAALAALGSLLTLAALPCLRPAAVSLRWDSQCWWIGAPDRSAAEVEVVGVEVVIDLSAWILLRVRLKSALPWAAVRWVPVQRRGLESQWHALRCAIYTSPASATADVPPQVPAC